MMDTIKRVLAPPVFQGDVEKTRRASFLNELIGINLLVAVLIAAAVFLGNNVSTRSQIIAMSWLVVLALAWRILHSGRISFIAFALSILGFVFLTGANISLGTVRTPTAAFYVIWIIVVGVLFHLPGILMATSASSLAALGLILAENAGLLPQPNYSVGVTQWLNYTAVFGMTAVMVYYGSRVTRNALARAENEIDQRRQTEMELRKLTRAVEQSPASIIITDLDGKIEYVNPRFSSVTGYAFDEAIGKNPRFLRTDNTRLDTHRQLWDALTAGQAWQGEFVNRKKDGSQYCELANISPITDLNGVVTHYLAVKEDISERKRTEEQLRRTESLFRESIDTLNASFAIYDADDRLVLYNKLYSSYRTPAGWDSPLGSNSDHFDPYGRTFEEILRFRLADGQYLVPAEQQEQWIAERLLEHRQGNLDVVREMSKGLWIKVTNRRTPSGYVVGLRFNVTELCQARQTAEAAQQQLEKKHDELERIARYDALTKLPNRALLGERLEQALNQTRRRGQHLAVVFIDLDGFKAVNDTHGHEAGDHLLITLAERMKGALRDGDILARLGGDEFVAVLLDLADVDASAPMLNRLLDAAARPFQFGQARLQVSASLGVTFYPQAQGQDLEPDQLLRQADQAMYQAKQAGKSRFHVFDAEQDRNVRARHESMQSIERALSEGEFVLQYQPKVNLRTGEVIGVEALIRWLHPQQGLLPPADFLPMIEDHPLAVKLGQWVIESALAQMESWREVGLNMAVSINIGRRHLMQTDFVQRLGEALAAHPGLQPNCLELELLEFNAVNDLDRVSHIIQECRSIGVECALDDFGSGYSSLTGLKKLPVKYLKIDEDFIRDMLDSSDSLLILIGVLKLASAFDLKVIAEGVETAQHGSMLLELGCELGQGYGIAHPMPADELPGWVRDWKPDPTWGDVPRAYQVSS